ncbi:hypothetical protein HK096_004318 [Nowakowskiella sp. JEL0078]|nr:hypothetical protein HK096_004318 [Nowakowskiella sp. JEL0078]
MIRPRGGDFLYSDVEFEVMKADIQQCKSIGVDGVVFGLLTAEGKIDKVKTKILVNLAMPMNVTFHRAFDMTRNPLEALEDLIEIGGIQRILTSGQESTVLEGLNFINDLIKRANGRIIILPGGGVTPRNLQRILDFSPGLSEIHAALPGKLDSQMQYRNDVVFMGVAITTPEYLLTITNGKDVKTVAEILNKAH